MLGLLYSKSVFSPLLNWQSRLWAGSLFQELNMEIISAVRLLISRYWLLLECESSQSSHDKTALKRTATAKRVWACIHPPNPSQSSPWSLDSIHDIFTLSLSRSFLSDSSSLISLQTPVRKKITLSFLLFLIFLPSVVNWISYIFISAYTYFSSQSFLTGYLI